MKNELFEQSLVFHDKLTDNYIRDEGEEAFYEGLKRNSTLTELNLDSFKLKNITQIKFCFTFFCND